MSANGDAASVPVQAGPALFESTTPTGAALVVEVTDEWSPMPLMTVGSVGSGAGSRDSDEVANVLRLVTGERDAEQLPHRSGAVRGDRRRPRPAALATAIAAVLAVGAQDAWVSPITMKKGRPAMSFCALCSEAGRGHGAGGDVPGDDHDRCS